MQCSQYGVLKIDVQFVPKLRSHPCNYIAQAQLFTCLSSVPIYHTLKSLIQEWLR